MASFIPAGKQQFFDSNGNTLVGGKIYIYIPGTTTPKTTYQDEAGMVANANPIVLDANGECTIFGSGAYRQQLFDSSNNLLWDQVTGTDQLQDLQDTGTPLTVTNLTVTGTAIVPTQAAGDNSTKAATTAFVTTAFANTLLNATLYGLVTSYTSASSFSVAPGGAISDDFTTFMPLASIFSKTFASFATGNGNGSLDTGAVAISSFYHIWLIYNTTSKTADILTSLSATSPSMPTGFSKKVKIGALYNNSSGALMNYVQNGNEFLYSPGTQDFGGTALPSSPLAQRLTIPTGLKVYALFRGQLYNGASGNTDAILFYSPDEGAQTPTINASGGMQNASLIADAAQSGNNGLAAGDFSVRSNTLGQIMVSGNTSAASFVYGIWTKGFVYPRGLT